MLYPEITDIPATVLDAMTTLDEWMTDVGAYMLTRGGGNHHGEKWSVGTRAENRGEPYHVGNFTLHNSGRILIYGPPPEGHEVERKRKRAMEQAMETLDPAELRSLADTLEAQRFVGGVK